MSRLQVPFLCSAHRGVATIDGNGGIVAMDWIASRTICVFQEHDRLLDPLAEKPNVLPISLPNHIEYKTAAGCNCGEEVIDL